MEYFAHIAEDGRTQTVAEHSRFARDAGAGLDAL